MRLHFQIKFKVVAAEHFRRSKSQLDKFCGKKPAGCQVAAANCFHISAPRPTARKRSRSLSRAFDNGRRPPGGCLFSTPGMAVCSITDNYHWPKAESLIDMPVGGGGLPGARWLGCYGARWELARLPPASMRAEAAL